MRAQMMIIAISDNFIKGLHRIVEQKAYNKYELDLESSLLELVTLCIFEHDLSFSFGPQRRRFHLPEVSVNRGSTVNLSLFDRELIDCFYLNCLYFATSNKNSFSFVCFLHITVDFVLLNILGLAFKNKNLSKQRGKNSKSTNNKRKILHNFKISLKYEGAFGIEFLLPMPFKFIFFFLPDGNFGEKFSRKCVLYVAQNGPSKGCGIFLVFLFFICFLFLFFLRLGASNIYKGTQAQLYFRGKPSTLPSF